MPKVFGMDGPVTSAPRMPTLKPRLLHLAGQAGWSPATCRRRPCPRHHADDVLDAAALRSSQAWWTAPAAACARRSPGHAAAAALVRAFFFCHCSFFLVDGPPASIPQGGRPRLCLGGIIAQPEGRGAGCRGEVRRAFCMKRDCRSCLREESPWRRDAESVARCYRPSWHANGMRVVRARRWGCLCLVDVGYAIRCAEDAIPYPAYRSCTCAICGMLNIFSRQDVVRKEGLFCKRCGADLASEVVPKGCPLQV